MTNMDIWVGTSIVMMLLVSLLLGGMYLERYLLRRKDRQKHAH